MSAMNPGSRPAYKVEELLALRASASESRVSLEKFPDEEVIKDHVLKIKDGQPTITIENRRPYSTGDNGSINGTLEHAQSYHANQAGLYGSTPIGPKRPSPTPSFKRNKVSQLLKQHGSPPHVRVTAGGRIVPSDLPQLGSPRMPFTPAYDSSRGSSRIPYVLPNGLGALNQLPQGFLAYNHVGKLVQWVDGHWRDIRSDLYGQPMYQIPPPNTPFLSVNGVLNMAPGPMAPMPMVPREPAHPFVRTKPASIAAPTSEDVDAQISTNSIEYERLRLEKIALERHEVKISEHITAKERNQIVLQKRDYVTRMDVLRKRNIQLEAMKVDGSLTNSNDSSAGGNGGTGVSSFPTPLYHMGGIDGAISAAFPVQPWSMPHPASVGVFPGAFNGMQPWTMYPAGQASVAATAPPNEEANIGREQQEITVDSPVSEPSPSSRAPARRSHAVEIRDPKVADQEAPVDHDHDGTYLPYQSGTKSASGEHPSNLNPTSPSYEPGKPYPLTEGSPPHFIVPAPTPIETPNPPPAELAKHWVFNQQQEHANNSKNIQMHSQSLAAQHQTRLSIKQASINGRDGDTNTVAGEKHDNSYGNGHNGRNGPGHIYSNRSSGEENGERSSQRPTSHSSVTTTDFFPVNTHEHSFNKYMSRKTSAAVCLLTEEHPCTPMRGLHSGAVSPMTDQLHPRAPPVSPAAQYGVPPHLLASSPEDMRLSSFLRETSRVPPPSADEHIPSHVSCDLSEISPVRAETRDEFHGKSRPYLEGYLAGSSGHAPVDPKNHEYCTGYIDGLSKTCSSDNNITRGSSTVSLKSNISVSATPPNTTDNRSLIAELAGTMPTRGDNVRLTQSLNFSSPPPGSNHPGNEPSFYADFADHASGNCYTNDDTKCHRVVPGYNPAGFSHLPRSWSEDAGGVTNPRSSFLPSSGLWKVTSHQTKILDNEYSLAQPQCAVISHTSATSNRRSDRMVSTSPAFRPSLTGYSGNQPAARVGSVPQHSVFGDDKYVITAPKATAIEATHTSHENQRSIGTTISRNSTYDGAMDDLAEMKTPAVPVSEATKHGKNTSSIGTGYPSGNSGTPQTKMLATTSTVATPAGSPSKSTSSPKKVTSPRHHLQKLKEKVGDYLDRSTNCVSERSGEQSRAESPDPKHMSPEEKKRWREGWRSKLGRAKFEEDKKIQKWKKEGGGLSSPPAK